MTDEEYDKFIFSEQKKHVIQDSRNDPPGYLYIFKGYYGISAWFKENGKWVHELRPDPDQ